MYLFNQAGNSAQNSADITKIYYEGNDIYLKIKTDGGVVESEKVATFANEAEAKAMLLEIVKNVSDFNVRMYEIPKSYTQADRVDQMIDYHHKITKDIVKNIWES